MIRSKCGLPDHIRRKCPKTLSRIARENRSDGEDEEEKNKHTSKANKKKGYLNSKVVHHFLSVLDQVNLSDVDTDSEDEATPKGKKTFDWAMSNGK